MWSTLLDFLLYWSSSPILAPVSIDRLNSSSHGRRHLNDTAATTDLETLSTMPQIDWVTALSALSSTIAISTSDVNDASKALGYKETILYGKDTFSRSQGTMTQQEFRNRTVSSTKPFIRMSTSLAFLYLAYNDHRRAKDDCAILDTNVEAASWRWKAWALCGATGLLVGPLGPYHGLLTRPLERRLQSRKDFAEREARKLVSRWGRLSLGKGMLLLVTLPFGLVAFMNEPQEEE